MTTKTIKISETNYSWLINIASEIQKRKERPVSFDEAIMELKNKMKKNKSLKDLAGSWKMSDLEADKLKKDIKKGWEKWEIRSV